MSGSQADAASAADNDERHGQFETAPGPCVKGTRPARSDCGLGERCFINTQTVTCSNGVLGRGAGAAAHMTCHYRLERVTHMTIPAPTFLIVDECPGWCTFNHDKFEPGDHEAPPARLRPDDLDLIDSIDLGASADKGLEVPVGIHGAEALLVPCAGLRGSRAPGRARPPAAHGRLPPGRHRGV